MNSKSIYPSSFCFSPPLNYTLSDNEDLSSLIASDCDTQGLFDSTEDWEFLIRNLGLDTQHTLHEHQVDPDLDVHLFGSTNEQMFQNSLNEIPYILQMITDPSSTAADEGQCNSGTHTTSLANALYSHLDGSSIHQSITGYTNGAESCIPAHPYTFPLSPLCAAPLVHPDCQNTSLRPASLDNLSFAHPLSHTVAQSTTGLHTGIRLQHPPRSARNRRPARAVEYDGVRIDEAELRRGLIDPDCTINLHKCRWEEDRSPCHLWVKCDKSYVKSHIQRWHGGKPGGEKVRIACRWPGCGQKMSRDSIPRHIINIHLGEVWECQGCGKDIARNDAYGRHAAKSKINACQNSGALIKYAVDVKVVNARAALDEK